MPNDSTIVIVMAPEVKLFRAPVSAAVNLVLKP